MSIQRFIDPDTMTTELKQALREWCQDREIPVMGVAAVSRWELPPMYPWMPESFYPRSIYPDARSVIVIGLPVHLPVLETTPSIYYHELYQTMNRILDENTYQMAEWLNQKGYPSLFVPRDGYGSLEVLLKNPVAFFSHRHAAYLSGLGTFGINNMILTPGYGPRIRFGSVFTAATIPPDPVMQEDLCIQCMRCVEMCPSQALYKEAYPRGITNKDACGRYTAGLFRKSISPCGICIKVCPVGADRAAFHREDPSIYEREHTPADLSRSWDHVRAYGGL